MDMLNQLLAAQVDHSLIRKLKTYTEPDLLVADECEVVSNVEWNAGNRGNPGPVRGFNSTFFGA